MGSNIDKAKGLGNEIVGKAKQAIGNISGNEALRLKGLAQQQKGIAQKAVGDAKATVKKIVDDAAAATRPRDRLQMIAAHGSNPDASGMTFLCRGAVEQVIRWPRSSMAAGPVENSGSLASANCLQGAQAITEQARRAIAGLNQSVPVSAWSYGRPRGSCHPADI
eukprot:gene29454-33097_t